MAEAKREALFVFLEARGLSVSVQGVSDPGRTKEMVPIG